MGTITRNFVNGLTTNGVLGASNINNASLNNITSISASAMTLISSATASSSASIEFSLGNFKEYQFFFVNMHPSDNNAQFGFQASIDNGSSYGVNITSSFFNAFHSESDITARISLETARDLAQSTSYQVMTVNQGNNNDDSASGYLHLFNPSSTIYVKHFMSRVSNVNQTGNPAEDDNFMAGYFNDTNDLTNIKFQMSSGNIDAGTIYMYGIGA